MLTHLKSLTFLTYFTVHYNHQQMSRDWERPAGGVVPSPHQDNAKSDWAMCPVVTVMVITVWVMSAWPGLPSVRLGPGQSAGVSQDRHNTTVCCTLRTAPRVWRNPQTWRMISSRNSIEYWELFYVVTRGEETDSGAAGNVHVHVEWWWCASLQSLHTDLHPTPTQPTLHLFIAKLFKILP